MKTRIVGFIITLLVVSCNKETTSGSHPPQIAFLSISPKEIVSGSSTDEIAISFEFQDKDGDLTDERGMVPNIFITQNLDTSLNSESILPAIPDALKNHPDGVKGIATVRIPAAFFLLDSLHAETGDTFHFEIYIMDNAGQKSNTIITPDILLRPS